MFNKVKDFFQGSAGLVVDQRGQPTSRDLQIATAILLLEMAGIDEDYAPEEIQACFRTMEEQFNIGDSEILQLMEEAQTLRDKQGKIDEFVAAFPRRFAHQLIADTLLAQQKPDLARKGTERELVELPHAYRIAAGGRCTQRLWQRYCEWQA